MSHGDSRLVMSTSDVFFAQSQSFLMSSSSRKMAIKLNSFMRYAELCQISVIHFFSLFGLGEFSSYFLLILLWQPRNAAYEMISPGGLFKMITFFHML